MDPVDRWLVRTGARDIALKYMYNHYVGTGSLSLALSQSSYVITNPLSPEARSVVQVKCSALAADIDCTLGS
jgi:hypothetical protein